MRSSCTHLFPVALAAAFLSPFLAAQNGDATSKLPPDPWRAPILDSGPGPDGLIGGLWASGNDFKASFTGGFAFYPLVGELGSNQPLQWRTRELRRGADRLARFGREPVAKTTSWRCEYDLGALVEAYDVRADGVEQTFVLSNRPAGDGDLAIVGEVATPMHAEPRAPAHGEIVFHAFGGPLVRYGKAIAIDANGNQSPVRAGWDGSAITLLVDDAFLDRAVFPLVVDPLFGRVVVATATTGTGGFPDVGHETMTPMPAFSTLFSYSRLFATGDSDGYARLTMDDLTGTTTVFTDLTASWSTPFLRNSFVGGAAATGMWVIALQRTTMTGSTIWLHTRLGGDLTASTTTIMVPVATTGVAMINPDVGGTGSFVGGSRCLITCQQELAGGTTSDLVGYLYDAALGTFTPVPLTGTPGTGLDRQFPFVSQYCGGSTLAAPGAPQNAWLVTWQQYENGVAGDDWDVWASLIGYDGAFGGQVELGDTPATVHCLHPQVAGQRGRYAITYAKRVNVPPGKYAMIDGPMLEGQRLDWAFGSPPAVLVRTMIDDLAAPPNPPGTIFNCCCAFDSNAREFWAGSYLVVADSLPDSVRGHLLDLGGAVLDKYTVFDNGTDDGGFSGCTFDARNGRFPIGYFTEEMVPYTIPLWAEAYLPAGVATAAPYGAGCGARARSFYELFATGAADLNGRTVRMTRNGLGGYDVATTVGGGIVPPTTPGLGLGDDTISAVIALPFAFDFPGGTTSAIRVDSNGRVFLGGGAATSSFMPAPAVLLGSAMPLLCPAWSDLLPNATNNVHFHTSGPFAYVTWNGCPMYGAPGSVNFFQVMLANNGTDDIVEFRYQTWGNSAGAGLTGWSPGLGARDPLSRDLTAGPFSTATDGPPVQLSATARPRLGTAIGLVTSDLPAGSVLVVNVLGVTPIVPGVELSSIGMPTCYLHVSLTPAALDTPPILGGVATRALAIPASASLAGAQLVSQSGVFVPGINPFQMVTTNGLDLRLDVL